MLHLLGLSTDLGPGLPCTPFTDQHIDEGRCGQQGREVRLIQAILHNLAFRDQQVHTVTYKLSSKTRPYFKHGEDLQKHMALLTELLTQVNKTFGTKYMYRNAKRNKIAIFSFQVTNFTQFAFL